MGEEIALGPGVSFDIRSPLPARFVLFGNGEKIAESESVYEFRTAVDKTGVYRVEAYLDTLGAPFDRTPWIISNPIYVR